ncbi:MAG: hypothetical protein QM775_07395 [Pirellulales bacterium]
MAYIAILLTALLIGLCLKFLRGYGLLLLVDMITIATMKSQLDPRDDHPGLLRVLAPSLILTLFATAGSLAEHPLLWFVGLLPAAAITLPVLKQSCRMSWPTAVKTTAVTVAVHAALLLLLYYLGFRFEIVLDNDGVW